MLIDYKLEAKKAIEVLGLPRKLSTPYNSINYFPIIITAPL